MRWHISPQAVFFIFVIRSKNIWNGKLVIILGITVAELWWTFQLSIQKIESSNKMRMEISKKPLCAFINGITVGQRFNYFLFVLISKLTFWIRSWSRESLHFNWSVPTDECFWNKNFTRTPVLKEKKFDLQELWLLNAQWIQHPVYIKKKSFSSFTCLCCFQSMFEHVFEIVHKS